jgi:capsule polysaccharide export protein KpsE/RkpR
VTDEEWLHLHSMWINALSHHTTLETLVVASDAVYAYRNFVRQDSAVLRELVSKYDVTDVDATLERVLELVEKAVGR